MNYEPVGYIIEYEISALIFLIVIMTRYFDAKRFPNQRNSMFSFILWIAVADIVLDIVSSLIIDNVFLVPVHVTFIVNEIFYFLQILLSLLMAVYAIIMVEPLTSKRLKAVFPVFLPGIVLFLMLFTNPLTHGFFYVDRNRGYIHGDLFMVTYGVCLFYILVTLFVIFRNRKILRNEECTTIYVFIGIIIVSMGIQIMNPELLITGVAIALAITLMYFTIQNPDTMLDNPTGAFTYEALITFLKDRRQGKEKVRLVIVKIHNIERINETLGVENSNLLLKKISRFLSSNIKNSWVFRMRSNCFIAISREKDAISDSAQITDRRIGEPWIVGDVEVLLQATVCYVDTENIISDEILFEETINHIEAAFLQEEQYGNPVNIIKAGPELIYKLKRIRAIEEGLKEAIKTGEGLELFLQPIWSVKEKKYKSAEVLLRFKHPTLGAVSPEEFVPIAENGGLVTAMDELVVRKACRLIRDNNQLKKLNIESLEINLSALEFMRNRLPEVLKDIMSHYQVDPGLLCFEITETAATKSFELLKESMEELKKIGCKFALDDFGTGYANISHVIQLPFSIVKLDRSLLCGSKIVLEDMARMFIRMNRITVMEGVETKAQSDEMIVLGVDYIQGYYYGKPMSPWDFVDFMNKEKND